MSRSLDIILSLTAVAALAPVLVLIAITNYAFTGSVLFRQVRIGRAGRRFLLLKFQTMVSGADRGSTVTVAGDRRVTPLGRLLRTTKLDELPQLFNVLRGEMSLVGPRALTPNEVAAIPPDIALRVYAIRPGMTGLASLALTNEAQLLAAAQQPERYYYDVILPRKMTWELCYVQRRSLWLDCAILACTPVAIVWPESARAALRGLIGMDPTLHSPGMDRT